MAGRRTSRVSFVEERWRPLLQRVDPAQLRRGKALAKQGAVMRITVSDHWIHARVRSSGGFGARTYRTVLPCLDWWAPIAHDVARWFALRPDWYAALWAGEWPEDFRRFLDDNGLVLLPNETAAGTWETESDCDCADLWRPCKHVVAVAYRMIWEVESDPLRAFEYVGIPKEKLADLVHDQARAWADTRAVDGTASAEGRPDESWWPEERAVWRKIQPVRRVVGEGWTANLDPDRFARWRRLVGEPDRTND